MARVAYVFGKKLANARDRKAMTQRELGEAIGGVSDETISRVERHDVAGILAKRLPRLAAVLGLSLEEFKAHYVVPASQIPDPNKTGITAAAGLPAGIKTGASRAARAVPQFSIGIAASRRVEKLSEHADANRLVATSDKRAFTAPVDGDCQHPKWKHGEIVVFSYDAFEREGVVPGKSYYLAFADGTTTFKRVFLDESDPDVYILRCWNRKKYPQDQRAHATEVVRIAKAVSKQVMVEENDE